MTDEELQQIKARAEAATKGPWGVLEKGISRRPPNNCPTVFATDTDLRFIAQCRDINEWNTGKPTDNLANAKFIAHARDDVPRLVAEVERLRSVLQSLANANVGISDPRVMASHAADALKEPEFGPPDFICQRKG